MSRMVKQKRKVIDERIGELEIEELVLEWGQGRDADYSRDQMKHNEMSDQIFLQRMMLLAEQE